MDARSILIVAVPLLLLGAVILAIATTVGRSATATGQLGREARRADRSALPVGAARADLDAQARARFEETRAGLEPAGAVPARREAAGGLVRFGPPADVEAVGVSRRQFFNRGILAAQGLTLGAFGAAMVGFLWPSLTGGFGG